MPGGSKPLLFTKVKRCVACLAWFGHRKASGSLYHTLRWEAKVTCSNRCHIRHRWATRKESVPDRFWRQVQRGSKTACWPWLGAQRCNKGYGGFHLQGRKMERAHRMAWRLTRGDIPAGLVVRHRCDNPPCCNPHHLELGTIADNNRDRDARGRHVALTREQHPMTKVLPIQLAQMVAKYSALPTGPAGKRKQGSVAALAASYGISASHLCQLGKGAESAQ